MYREPGSTSVSFYFSNGTNFKLLFTEVELQEMIFFFSDKTKQFLVIIPLNVSEHAY